MKILVCIKQVPIKESTLRLREDSKGVREEDLSFGTNEPDTFALEEAVRLKEAHGGEVVVASLGPARVQASLREALAKGADRAVHVETDAGESLDRRWAASMIASAVRQETFDLVLTGLQSDDLGTGQTGVILAELLELPHATIVKELRIEGTLLRAKRELEGGWFEWVEMQLPALLTVQSGMNKPRYASLLGIKKAKTKDLRRVTPSELGVPDGEQPSMILRKIYAPVRMKNTDFLTGDAKDIARSLVEKLWQEIAFSQR
jgi:electron transfer flavoprotein beta subunit